MTGLVLDLRGNPGGYLDRATKLADEFIGGTRKIVYTDGKGDQYDTQTYSAGGWASSRKARWWCSWTKARPRPPR